MFQFFTYVREIRDNLVEINVNLKMVSLLLLGSKIPIGEPNPIDEALKEAGKPIESNLQRLQKKAENDLEDYYTDNEPNRLAQEQKEELKKSNKKTDFFDFHGDREVVNTERFFDLEEKNA